MTDKVLPSFGRTARSREFSAVFAYAGGSGEGIVWPSSSRLVEDSEGDLATGALGAYNHVSSSGLDVTIDTGEAIVRGAYCARDTQTTYTLPESSTTTIYLGWKDSQADTVVIGEASDFGSEDPSLAIWTFDTDSASVTGSTDERPLADAGYIAASSIKRGANIIDDGNENLAVSQGQGSGLNADTLRNNSPSDLRTPGFGDGRNGNITVSANENRSGVYYTEDFTVESGNTITVDSGLLVIFARNKAVIDGTIDATGQGGSGASPSSNKGDNGNVLPRGFGGSGGSSSVSASDITGGSGGDGDELSTFHIADFIGSGPTGFFSQLLETQSRIGGAGGGSGGKAFEGGDASGGGSDGSFPSGGGGGSGSDSGSGSDVAGGAGGAGGGLVFIVSPSIEGGGAIQADGVGGDGGNLTGGGYAGSGGGGGGNGGVIGLFGNNISSSIGTSVSGGTGGSGASGSDVSGGDGASGESGEVFKVEP